MFTENNGCHYGSDIPLAIACDLTLKQTKQLSTHCTFSSPQPLWIKCSNFFTNGDNKLH